MKRIDPHIRTALRLLAVTLIPVIAIYFLAVKPKQARLEQISSELRQKAETYHQLMSYKSQAGRHKLNAQLEHLDAQCARFLASPREIGEMDFIIRKLARDNGLRSFESKSLDVGALGTLAKTKYVGERRLKVSFEADFNAFVRFVNALETHHPILFVDEFSFVRDLETEDKALCEIRLAMLYELGRENPLKMQGSDAYSTTYGEKPDTQ